MRAAAFWSVFSAVIFPFIACAGRPSAAPIDTTASTADDCLARGGSCVPAGACGRGQGHMGREACAEGHEVCCYPESLCGGTERFECCAEEKAYRLTCKDGVAICPQKQAKKPIGECNWRD
jgi:hypothetical protein